MSKAVVSVATTPYYQRGMKRLYASVAQLPATKFLGWNEVPSGCQPHDERPYAFKAFALQNAAECGCKQLLWADACILPIRKLDRIWEHAFQHGVWISRNGWNNYQWTAESAYPDLFRDEWIHADMLPFLRKTNAKIPHVVATAFALDLDHEKGRAFLGEYYRLASETTAFCGPWANAALGDPSAAELDKRVANPRIAICGHADVIGHRHDQTAASVIAWRLDIPLTDPPDFFAYAPAPHLSPAELRTQCDPRTILVADGSYA